MIAPAAVVALLGPNGAGTSTTVDVLLGLTRPDAGTVTVFGASPHEAVATGAIGAMPQGGALLHDVTVGETVAMVASLCCSSSTSRSSRRVTRSAPAC